jgi:hypothetical protein
MLTIVYAGEEVTQKPAKSIFLVGPTPRSKDVPSWRPKMIAVLESHGYDGVVFSPEPRDGVWLTDYLTQVEWEKKHLEMCDLIIAWVPRDLNTMPAFTTNVEFGKYVGSGKLIYGRPDSSPKNRYLDWMYRDHKLGEPHNTKLGCAEEAITRLAQKT